MPRILDPQKLNTKLLNLIGSDKDKNDIPLSQYIVQEKSLLLPAFEVGNEKVVNALIKIAQDHESCILLSAEEVKMMESLAQEGGVKKDLFGRIMQQSKVIEADHESHVSKGGKKSDSPSNAPESVSGVATQSPQQENVNSYGN